MLVLAAVIAVTLAIGLLWRARSGRVRPIAADSPERAGHSTTGESIAAIAEGAGGRLGESLTLVQFSTEMCAYCPATRRRLTALATEYDGARFVEVDLTHDLDLARRARIMQTPTVIVLDADGRERARIGGAPNDHQLRGLLDDLTTRARTPSGPITTTSPTPPTSGAS